ncbi:MAG: tyrosine-protein phosphatase [Bacteroidaceae bacterium]|nr:tyrosine-protein phosphatase [Bacteroidaceae bacterium]
MKLSGFRFWLPILLVFIAIGGNAQNKSSYASVLANADWGWKLQGGVYYGKASFDDLYGNPQRVSIAKYSQSEMSTSLYVKEHSSQGTNSLAVEAGATAAINGSYFNMSTFTSTTALWVDGKEIATTAPEEFARVNGIVGFKDDTFYIEPYSSSTTSSQLAAWGKKYDSFVASGPIIRRGGVSMNANIGGEGFYGPHPRTLLGKCADGTVYMVIMEGRMEGASGFSLENVVALAEDLNMTDAINLDGGGSSTLWVTGAGVVNKPSGGAVRNVPNIIIATPGGHEHNYVNGFCTCLAAPYEPARKDSKGYYEIDNGGKLFWLAQLVNNGEGNADARLTADIDLEYRQWTPMGNNASKHSGEFDGQGHTIKKLKIVTDASTTYSAFIGIHNGTKDIHNFRIIGSVSASGTTEQHYAAGVVAYSSGNHKIQDIWCSVDITNPSSEQVSLRMAGIVTKAETSTIDRCVYDGTVKGANTNLQVAGILGWPNANNTTVSNCLFAGQLTSTGVNSGSAYLGGIVGYSSSARGGLSFINNLSIGKIDSPKSATRSGALVGNNTAAVTSYSNNYILEGQPVAGSGTASGRIPEVTVVTAAQLTDGSLPAKLDVNSWAQGPAFPIPQKNGEPPTEDDLTVDGIKYVVTGDNTVSVTYPNAEQPSASNPCTYSGEVTVPPTVMIKGRTYSVTAIGDYAFHYADITSLHLPEGITTLGYKAIYQTQLTEIVVPNSVTLMDYEALGYNKVLVKITFGEHIADNTWGDKLCIYGGKKYEVYMNCDAVPKLRSYTFDFTGANVHVRPAMYAAFMADAAWSSYDIIGDLWKEYTYDDLQKVINDYAPLLPTGDAVGTDPGCYTTSSTQALADALAQAQSLDQNATLEQLNKAINGILVAHDALCCNPLHEGYYYFESVGFPGYALTGDAASAAKEGLKAVALEDVETPPYFKLVRKNGGWLMQCADNGMYVGTTVGTGSGSLISLTEEPLHEQTITWASGGQFKIQGSSTYPYSYTGTKVRAYNYTSGGSLGLRQMWHLHPATTGMFDMDYNLENGRVRGFLHDFEYTQSDASKVSTYNVSPPDRRDWPLPVEVHWTREAAVGTQQIMWSESPDFTDATTLNIPSESASYEIHNLIPGRTYYCKVMASGKECSTVRSALPLGLSKNEQSGILSTSFNTTGQMRHLRVKGTANVRDLGGWPTASGRTIRYGKLFRGAELNGGHSLEPEGIEALRQAGIKAELDLRSDSEAKNITKSVLGDDITYRRTALAQTASHVEGLTNSKSIYKAALQFVFTCVKNDKPTYFHCAIGRDRTGTLAFLLEGLLGVSKSDIYKDYELTNFSYFNTPCSKGQLDDMFSKVEAQEGETLEEKFRTYLTTYFGISSKDIDAFREKMLTTDNEDPDGISTTRDQQAMLHDNASIYDLRGLQLSDNKHPRGICIQHGRKVLKK